MATRDSRQPSTVSPSRTPATIGLTTATAVVVANMVGVGVFTSLGFQVVDLPTGFPILLLWTVGGVLALCGALCYAELGAMSPRSGGEYHLLGEGLHPLAGFLAGWVSVTVGFSAPTAAAATAFGEYLGAAWGGIDARWFAVPIVVAVTAIHLGRLRVTGRFQIAFTTCKILLILLLIGAAAASPVSHSPGFMPQSGDGALILGPVFAISLVYVMYAYTGWNAAAYIAGEIRDPQRNLPRALLIGTALVMAIYVALNAAFLKAAPVDALAGQVDVGRVAAVHLFGERGGTLMALLIAFGLISSISSMTWAGPRVTQTMGEDHRPLRPLAVRNRFGVPARAIVVQSLVVIALVTTVTFESLILYIESLLILSSMATVATVMWLRHRRPDTPRPFRTPGYPVTPLLYLAVSGWMLWVLTAKHPTESLWGLATLILGGAVYAASKRGIPGTAGSG